MGLFSLFKSNDDEKNKEKNRKLEREMERYNLNKEEKELVRKGYYQPDEFDRDDDEDSDED